MLRLVPAPHRARLKPWLAFAAVYFVWGSTFLAIRYAIAGIPPLLMCGARLLIAGAIMLLWAWRSGAPWPRGIQWRNAVLVGLMLPAIGNGSVTLGETHVPSGLVALLVATIPMWMALLGSLGPRGVPLRRRVIVGLAIGFGGIALLVGPSARPGSSGVQPAWALLPILGGLSWAFGSLWSRRVDMPSSPIASTAVGLTAGGLALLALGGLLGEGARLTPAALTPAPLAALLYLAVFGSVVGLTAYLWLLGRVSPTRVSTYAFVNPVVAMTLGCLVGGEPFGPRTFVAGALVVAAVALIVTAPTSAPGVRVIAGVGHDNSSIEAEESFPATHVKP